MKLKNRFGQMLSVNFLSSRAKKTSETGRIFAAISTRGRDLIFSRPGGKNHSKNTMDNCSSRLKRKRYSKCRRSATDFLIPANTLDF